MISVIGKIRLETQSLLFSSDVVQNVFRLELSHTRY